MFIAAVFTIAKTWKQPKCLWTDECIKKMWYICTMEYYSAIKKNEILPFAATQMDLEIIILSEVSQKEKDEYHMISLIYGVQNMTRMNLSTKQKQTHRQRTDLWLPRRGAGEGQIESLELADANYYIQNG